MTEELNPSIKTNLVAEIVVRATPEFASEYCISCSSVVEHMLDKRKVAASIMPHGVDFWMNSVQADFPFYTC